MAGNILGQYIGATSMTTTTLDTLAASQTWIAGWTSDLVDNGTNEYEDYLVSCEFVTAASARQIGQLYVFIYANMGDTTMIASTPDLFATGTEGAQGAATFSVVEQRDAGCHLMWAMQSTATASEVYVMPPTSVASFFGGWVPDQWALFITGNLATTTAAQFASSDVFYLPVHRRFT